MIRVRKSHERGHFDHGWLDTFHSFSFGEYFDEEHVHYRALRVINEDRVAPGMGFGSHPHRDMEILTWVLDGALRHRDSLGHGAPIRPGEVQRMSAGTGIVHSEFNDSEASPVHLLQIWILPDRRGHQPGYDQKSFEEGALRNRLAVIASPDGADGSVAIHQDARVYAGRLDPGASVSLGLREGRGAWVQVARGSVEVNGVPLAQGDGAAVEEEGRVEVVASQDAEVLLFDLA